MLQGSGLDRVSRGCICCGFTCKGQQPSTLLEWRKMPQGTSIRRARAPPANTALPANAVPLPQVFPQVLGVEITQRRCTMAQHNASLYGVAQRVNMLCADFFAVAPTMLADAIFVSPPWGGPTYQYCESFDVLSSMIGGPRSVNELLVVCLGVVKRTWGKRAAGRGAGTEAEQQLQAEEPRADGQDEGAGVVSLFLPRNTDLQQLETLVPQGSIWLVERNFVNGKLKGITAYCF